LFQGLAEGKMARLKILAFEPVFSTDEVQVHRMVLAPEEEVPWHFHNHVRDTFYVLRGPVTVYTREPEATTVIDTGQVLQTHDRQPHRVVNESNHEVSVLLIQGVGSFDFQPLPPPR
jgi:quercetin dioxygenase-like cupin family protein